MNRCCKGRLAEQSSVRGMGVSLAPQFPDLTIEGNEILGQELIERVKFRVNFRVERANFYRDSTALLFRVVRVPPECQRHYREQRHDGCYDGCNQVHIDAVADTRTMSNHHARLSSCRWEHVRRQAFKRDGYRCQQCGKPGRLEAHHIIDLDQGGAEYDLSNIRAYCRDCHIAHHRKPLSPEREAWRVLVAELLDS